VRGASHHQGRPRRRRRTRPAARPTENAADPAPLHGLQVLFAYRITLDYRVLAGAGAGGVTPAEGQPQSVVR